MREFDGNFYIYLFMMFFIVIFSICIIVILSQWMKNKRAPQIVISARILDLGIRQYYHSRKRYGAPGRESTGVKLYYAVFHTEDGERIELRVSKLEYYKLKKGYVGKLTFQGTKYISFERMKMHEWRENYVRI